jgi:hypothetical protein
LSPNGFHEPLVNKKKREDSKRTKQRFKALMCFCLLLLFKYEYIFLFNRLEKAEHVDAETKEKVIEEPMKRKRGR